MKWQVLSSKEEVFLEDGRPTFKATLKKKLLVLTYLSIPKKVKTYLSLHEVEPFKVGDRELISYTSTPLSFIQHKNAEIVELSVK